MATTESSAIAHPSTPEEIAQRVERELSRIRKARPHLASRIDRAANLLVTHLSCRRQRLIRARVGRDGRVTLLVTGSGGAVYLVNPGDWSCSCPDYHRRGKGCKHGLACYALWRASARPAPTPCVACGEGFALREQVEVGPEQAEHSLDVREGERYCRPCARRHGVL